MNKVLIGIPTAPFLNYGEYEAKWPDNEWDRANRRWERIYGRFNGPSSERQQAVRDTWAPEVVKQGATFKFFMGNTATEEHKADDVVLLDCGDKYLFDLQAKIQKMAIWALDNNFDVMGKLDDDSFVYPALVPFLQETKLDFFGCVYGGYCVGGGTGEFFGRRALEVLAKTPLEVHSEARHWEDHWIGCIMRDAGIKAVHVDGFTDEPAVSPPNRYTFHPVSPKGMRQAYQEVYGHK